MAETTIIRVTWGKQLISPRQFNTFEVGPFEMTTTVRVNETEEDAFNRAYDFLDAMARSTYKAKIAAFEEAFRAAHAVRGAERGR
jgi:hypothetical protein